MENAAAVRIFTTKDKLERKCDKLRVVYGLPKCHLANKDKFLPFTNCYKKRRMNAIALRKADIVFLFAFGGWNLKEICQTSKFGCDGDKKKTFEET
ncbi:hypothetical protein JTE90_002752 [Oedothorax gibbosus]|uniref:Uncharacterized protein n=1 Tax=Oedothorax gibbosus TaxID=931172 RepID=A0AAV6UN85_9ARAC|nr:hypothetical protein JTE90_002752 [Oedothorax gibbosus]